MYRVSGISIKAAGLCLMLGAVPSLAGPPNNDVSDAFDNTAGGTGALQHNTTGPGNTAFGFFALQNNTTGPRNTAFGADALLKNTTGDSNTAVGVSALQTNTTGLGNTAVGSDALNLNTTGAVNTALGASALFSNTTGANNTAIGVDALAANNTGGNNTAAGLDALEKNTTGANNTAIGDAALLGNTTGGDNVAIGESALASNAAGSNNIAVGLAAGSNLTSGSNNIYLGASPPGSLVVESNTMRLGQVGGFGGGPTRTFIAGVAGTALSGSQVLVSRTGQLGILASSARYKRDISAMGISSRKLLELRPVTFRYKQDPQRIRQYGLIAEEVAKVYPELVTRRSDGTVESVQYHELIPMLLNELQRQQRELTELKIQSARLHAALPTRLVRLEKTTYTAPLASR